MKKPKAIEARPERIRRESLPTQRTRPSWRFIGGAALVVVVAGIAFFRPLQGLALHASEHDLHSHILLIPFISMYLLWIRRDRLPQAYRSSPGYGLIAAIMAAAAFACASLLRPQISTNDYLGLATLSFICFVWAGAFIFLGGHWVKTAVFPLSFLVFMVPLPDALVAALETGSKIASAEAASLFFAASGTPVLRDGTVFQLPGIIIEVAQECSGIRSSLVLFITSLLASYLFLNSTWRRSALIAFVIPLGIVRNGFRILVIGLLCVHVGPEMIHSIIHKKGGPFFFVLSLVPLFCLLWWLRKGENRRAEVNCSRLPPRPCG